MKLKFTLFLIFQISVIHIFCQPSEMNAGLDLLSQNKFNEAKVVFKDCIKKYPSDYGGYNFLGICFFKTNDFDSTIFYLKKSVELNLNNTSHSREMTISRLSLAYLYKQDFQAAYDLLIHSIKEFPDNPVLQLNIKDVCLWSYYINHTGLDAAYLSHVPKKEYTVTTIPQEYLIMRTLRVDDHLLSLMNQRSNLKKKFDILTCKINKTQDSIALKFNLDWDVEKQYGGKYYNYKVVYENASFSNWERIGALLTQESKTNIIEEEEKLKKK